MKEKFSKLVNVYKKYGFVGFCKKLYAYIVANYFNITSDEILSSKRTQEISYARHIAMYLLRECTGLSLPKIGKELGGRNHATILNGINNIKTSMEKNEDTKKIIEELVANLTDRS